MAHHQQGGGSSSQRVRWSPHVSSSNNSMMHHHSVEQGDAHSISSHSTPRHANNGKPPLPMRTARSSSRSNNMLPSLPEPQIGSKLDRSSEESVSSGLSDGASSSHLGLAMTHPGSSGDGATATGGSAVGGEQWRKHGKLFRARLLMKDEESGGNTFVLSNNCTIERYYDVAGKVLDQFLKTSTDESADLTESYLVGNRLVKFLSTVLPTHLDYFSNHVHLTDLRNKSQAQLVELLQYLDQLALIIDEEELNKYILKDLNTPLSSPDSSPDRGVLFPSTASPIKQNRSSHSHSLEHSLDDLELSKEDDEYDSFDEHNVLLVNTITTTARGVSGADSVSELGASGRTTRTGSEDFSASTKQRSEARIRLRETAGQVVRAVSESSSQSLHNNTSVDASPRTRTFLKSSPKSHLELLSSSRENQSADWDERFSEYGADVVTLKKKQQQQQQLIQQIALDDSGLDGEMFLENSLHNAAAAAAEHEMFLENSIIATTTTTEQHQVEYETDLGSAWSPMFYKEDPFSKAKTTTNQDIIKRKPVVKRYQQPEGKPPASERQLAIYSSPVHSRGNTTRTRGSVRDVVHGGSSNNNNNKDDQAFRLLNLTPSSDNSSHRTPDAKPPQGRESSPQSVLELQKWQSSDETGGPEIRLHRFSDDCSSLGTHEDLDVSLRSRRKPLRHFKGCIKCLLE